MAIQISGLFIYPIKGCGGLSVQTLPIHSQGPQWDRHWMIVKKESGKFLTQREHPRMALIQPLGWTEESLEVTWPGLENPCSILLKPTGPMIEVEVWTDSVKAQEVSLPLSQVFSEFLNEEVSLVTFAPGSKRQIKEKYGQSEVSFADSLPMLVISEASLQGLNSRLDDPIPMDRFRPNVVVNGSEEPHFEDFWEEVEINGERYTCPKLCARCVVTTIDQKTGIKGKEPLATLSKYRRSKKGILFGNHFVHHNQGELKVGDKIHITKKKASLSL